MKPPAEADRLSSRLFAYGTLVFPEVMSSVTGRTIPSRPATLSGFSRFLVRDRVFPSILAERGGLTHGVLYEGVDQATLRVLDRFEGELYRCRELTVSLECGRTLEARAYILDESHRDDLTSEPWDPAEFAARHLGMYLQACREWKTRGGPAGA